MRFFMSIIPPADLRPEDISQGLMDAMGPWMEKALAEGTLISTAGLAPASKGKRLAEEAGKVVVTDGPYAEAKEVLGGYAIFEAPDIAAATALAEAFLRLHIEHGVTGVALELRPIEGGVNY